MRSRHPSMLCVALTVVFSLVKYFYAVLDPPPFTFTAESSTGICPNPTNRRTRPAQSSPNFKRRLVPPLHRRRTARYSLVAIPPPPRDQHRACPPKPISFISRPAQSSPSFRRFAHPVLSLQVIPSRLPGNLPLPRHQYVKTLWRLRVICRPPIPTVRDPILTHLAVLCS